MSRHVERILLHTVAYGVRADEATSESDQPEILPRAAAAEYDMHKAIGVLAQSHLRLAIKHALTYRSDTDEDLWEDLLQTCYLALCHAALKYDLRNATSARFTTYAIFWVRQQTGQEFRKYRRVSGPDGQSVQSLDMSLNYGDDGGTFSLMDMLHDPIADEKFGDAEQKKDVDTFLDLLPGREREAVSLYYNVDGHGSADMENRSFVDVGKLMGGISGEKARQIVQNGLERIKEYILATERTNIGNFAGFYVPENFALGEMPDMMIQMDLFD